jgi:hypothetical protein
MTECFELTYHGGGGFSWSEVWNMSIGTRKFNLKKINEYLERLDKIRNANNQKITERTDPKSINIPDFAKPREDSTFISKVKTKK